MRKLLLASIAGVALFAAGTVFAAMEDVVFPVADLGGCESKEACKTYCEATSHREACYAFGEKNGLMKKEEVVKAREFNAKTGPGGCRGEACKTYCANESHVEECIAFAEQNKLIPQEQIDRAKKLAGKPGPGGCRGEACKTYCANRTHVEECTVFAVENGFMTAEQAARNKEAAATRSTENAKPGPGGCTGEACRTYCSTPEHTSECLKFALDNGRMTQEQYDKALTFATKTGPGGCHGEECKTYCADTTHREECNTFAVENGIITKEQAERSRTLQNTVGPGGCQGGECKNYCEDATHREACVTFAKEKGFIDERRAQQIESFSNVTGPEGCQGEACKEYCADPTNRESCRKFGEEHAAQNQQNQNERRTLPVRPTNDQSSSGNMEQFPPVGRSCGTEEECKALEEKCRANPEACRDLRPEINVQRPATQIMPNASEAERKAIEEKCRANPEACRGLLEGNRALPPNTTTMTGEERQKLMRMEQEKRIQAEHAGTETRPADMNGVTPLEALRRASNPSGNVPNVNEHPRPVINMTEEQRRVSEITAERLKKLQNSTSQATDSAQGVTGRENMPVPARPMIDTRVNTIRPEITPVGEQQKFDTTRPSSAEFRPPEIRPGMIEPQRASETIPMKPIESVGARTFTE